MRREKYIEVYFDQDIGVAEYLMDCILANGRIPPLSELSEGLELPRYSIKGSLMRIGLIVPGSFWNTYRDFCKSYANKCLACFGRRAHGAITCRPCFYRRLKRTPTTWALVEVIQDLVNKYKEEAAQYGY